MTKTNLLMLLAALFFVMASARTINVVGEGSVSGTPDLATINLGVTTEARTAAEALSANNRRFANVAAVFKANGIEEKDIQTSSFDIFDDTRGRGENRTRVYTVSNDVTVKVRDVDSLGKVLDAVVRAGSNSVNGVTFGLQDPQKALDEGRKIAIKDAMRKAKLYADAAGVRVGKVLAISETAITETREEGSFGSGAARRAPSTFVSGGEVDVEVEVFVLYELLE